jgi:hypothetical protein
LAPPKKYAHASLKLDRESGSPYGEAVDLRLLGVIHEKLRDGRRAKFLLKKALDIFRQLEIPGEVARSLNDLANLLISLGEFEEARHILEEAAASLAGQEDIYGLAFVYANLGKVAVGKPNEIEDALYNYNAALAIFQQFRDKLNAAKVLRNLAVALKHQYRFEDAVESMNRALAELPADNPLKSSWERDLRRLSKRNSYKFTLTDSGTATSSSRVDITLEIEPTPSGGPRITTTTLTDGAVGRAYKQSLQATAGTAPLKWSVSPALPAGLTLDATAGVISGAPTAVSPSTNYKFTVTDSAIPPLSSIAAIPVWLIKHSSNLVRSARRNATPLLPAFTSNDPSLRAAHTHWINLCCLTGTPPCARGYRASAGGERRVTNAEGSHGRMVAAAILLRTSRSIVRHLCRIPTSS